ncbi:MAG: hypothetical protein NT062_16815, partial [Proteobacteria bacterium]|nr:hypothetical protein [Pseudomonadota bacterium]
MRVASIASSILFAACATTTPAERGGPRGLRASDHLAEAGQHDELAKQTTSWPDTRSGAGPEAVHIPWVRS